MNRLKAFIAPGLLFIIILAITLGMNKTVGILIDREFIQTENTTELITHLLQKELTSQIQAVEAVAVNFTENPNVAEASFRGFTLAAMNRAPALVAVAVLNPDLSRRHIHLNAEWADAHGFSLDGFEPLRLDLPAVTDPLGRVLRETQSRVLRGRPFDVTDHVRFPGPADGFTGFAVLAPFPVPTRADLLQPPADGLQPEGYVVGIFDTFTLKRTLLPWLRTYGLSFDLDPVDHRTRALTYRREGPGRPSSGIDDDNVRDFTLGSQLWRVTYDPPSLFRGTYSSLATSASILLLGLTLALLAAWLLHHHQQVARRSQSEARTSRTRLVWTVENLARLKEELDLIVNNVDEAIALYDDAFAPLQTNAAFQRAFAAVEVTGAGPLGAEQHHRAMELCFAGEGTYRAALEHLKERPERPYVDEIVAHGRDPRHPEVDYQRRAAAVIGPDGSRRGYLVIYQDITPRRAVDRLKEDFLAGVTHDLRTPLASIKGFAETMLRDRHMEPATREEFTRIICAESTRLQEMIEDLLDLRRMEAGKADLSPGSVNLRALVEEVAHASRPLLESKDLSLAKIEWVGDGERPVLGDVAKLGRAVRNILSNAIKYSRHGGRIWIRGVESENCVALEFTDEGPGIPEHEIDHVFEKFYRGSEHVRRTQGTGLGLAIVKNIVENHGGRVSARNAPKRGATIRIVLPWDLGSLAESADASEVNGSARTAAGVANA